jgi:DNA-binding GntR family transcriptional regulator
MARAHRAASVVSTLPVAEYGSARRGHRPSSGEMVAEHIRRLIFEGELKQGDHLRQDEIAAQLGVSRVPVREAVIALDREGWLMIEPHRGAFVHGLDENAVRDHYDVFGRLYGLTAHRATERSSGVAIAGLVAVKGELERVGDPESFLAVNNDYLRQLFAMAASPRLASLSRVLRNIVPGNFFAEVPAAMAVQKRGLAAVTEAVRTGNGVLAELECRKLMTQQGDAVVALHEARRVFRTSG